MLTAEQEDSFSSSMCQKNQRGDWDLGPQYHGPDATAQVGGGGGKGIVGPDEMGLRDWAAEDEGRVFVGSFKDFAWSASS